MLTDRFTNVSCAFTALALRFGWDSWSWKLGACLSVFVCVTFHAVLLVDATAHARFRAHHGRSPFVFHAGNLALHGLPAALALAHPPPDLRPVHVCAAHLVFVAWVSWVSRGTMLLDAVYVPLPPGAWQFAYAYGVAAMLLYLEWATTPAA